VTISFRLLIKKPVERDKMEIAIIFIIASVAMLSFTVGFAIGGVHAGQ
jgi:hypothetical protein